MRYRLVWRVRHLLTANPAEFADRARPPFGLGPVRAGAMLSRAAHGRPAGWCRGHEGMRRPHGGVLGAVLALSLAGTAAARPLTPAASPSLTDVPVAGMATVAAEAYAAAAALAAGGGSPLEIALAITGPFEGVAQHILQVNDGAEAATATRITVVRDGLLDDAVRGERWDIRLDRGATGTWRIREVRRAWRCRRGGPRERFATAACP